ncbi:unnamed protein product [Tilletia controversa]|nr:unnamed protein product [Tilletia controversa]CAD6976143.1 unnamed protein product [Tilletia controversa]
MTDPNFSTATFEAELHSLASQHNLDSTSHAQIAALLDDADPLAPLRKEYNLPSMKGLKAALARKAARDGGGGGGGAPTSTSTSTDGDADGDADADADALYLCGNSLGPQARLSSTLLNRELAVWSSVGVLGHFDHPHDEPWLRADEACAELMADLVGAKRAEVACMGTLTGNLHTLLATFYRPGVEGGVRLPRDGSIKRDESAGEKGKRRHKIVYEWKAFPSDQYALQSVVRLAGLDPSTSLIALRPRPSEDTLRTSDILHTLQTLAAEGETALLMLSGIQYYTGQFFDMQQITRAARECGIVVGWDLAHAFANVPLALHDWDVDFAAWCTYKYGSSGPGGIAGLFVHERWTKGVGVEELPR